MAKIRLGDTVRTQIGTGVVVGRRTWSEEVSAMTDVQARDFVRTIRARYGDGWKNKWERIAVEFKSGLVVEFDSIEVKET
jgi:hypothetical protein